MSKVAKYGFIILTETWENLMETPPPLKKSRNRNFEKTCENICCYYAPAVSWFFCAGEPMNPNNMLMSGGIFLFGRRTMYPTESEI